MSTDAAPRSIDDLIADVDTEYGAICSQIGEAVLNMEAARERLDALKVQREQARLKFQTLTALKGKYAPLRTVVDGE